MLKMISDDFRETEQCNYHMTTSHISNLPYALAFRVSSFLIMQPFGSFMAFRVTYGSNNVLPHFLSIYSEE